MRLSSICLIVITACGISLRGGVILSENFDELRGAVSVTSVGAFHTINGTNVDILGPANANPFCPSPESGNCVDMAGTGGDPQGQLQSNMLFPAGSYLLSFDLVGSHRGVLEVGFPVSASTIVSFGNYSHLFTLASTDVTSGIVVNQPVTLSSPDHLLFVECGAIGGTPCASITPSKLQTAIQPLNRFLQIGNLLDNVVVSTAPTTIPEPSSIFPIAFALFAGIIVTAIGPRSATRDDEFRKAD